MTIERSGRVDRARVAGVALIVGGLMAFTIAAFGMGSASASAPPNHKVTLCHRTASHTNPYVVITVDVASVLGSHGHDGHNGPVFTPGISGKWGDIIPPFDYGTQHYAGKNWTAQGQSILDAGCVVASVTTTSGGATSTTIGTTSTEVSTTTSGVTVTEGGGRTTSSTEVSATTVALSSRGGTLPRTGSSVLALVAAGFALMGCGSGLVLSTRSVAR
jgi:LPXTG-motif cell wall-anchored protein